MQIARQQSVKLIAVIGLLLGSQFAIGQTTVTYVMQTGNFGGPVFGDGGGFFNPDGARMGMFANFNGKQAAAWRTFKTAGDNTGSNRSLQVGDVFVITVSCTRAFGQIGFSLNAAGTQGSNYANRISGSRLYFNTDNYGAWYVNRSGGNLVLGAGYNPIQSTYKDYKFTIRVTSATTADVFLTVDATDYRAFNLTMNGSASIDAFSVYGSDMWDGDSNDDAFWKQTATVTNTGTVQLGYFLSSGTFTPGVISNGLDAASTSTTSVNNVFAGGNAGTFVILNQANTYSGSTTVNTNARLELQNAQALGTTSGLTVQNDATLSLFNASGISFNNYPVTINGSGQSSANGAIRSTGGNNTWPGNITLASASRVNADVTGAAGSLTLSGTIALGANTLTVGGATAGITISGNIGSTGGGITKDGNNTLTLSGINTYTGTTTVSAGTLISQKTGHTSTITTTTIITAFSPIPAAGTYAILPGALSGSQTFSATGLAANQRASFNAATGVVTVGSITPASTTLPAISTTYGTAATAQTVVITGTNLTGSITTSTAPTGFEVSSDGITYGATASFPAAGGTLRVRLKATAAVTGTNYNGQTINLTNGTATATVTTAASGNAVTAAALTITGVSANDKPYNGLTAAALSGTAAYSGLQNGESFSVTGTPAANFSSPAFGLHSVTVTGYTAPSTNYTISPPAGLSATINKAALTITGVTADDKTYDGNTTATLSGTPSYVGLQNGEGFSVTGAPSANFSSPAIGAHPVTITGYTAPTTNYSVSQPTGLSATITAVGESTADFRSKANGNFSSASTWEYDQGGNNWTNAGNPPTSINNVTIFHNVTLNQDFSVDASLTIGTGGTLTVNPTRTLTVTGAADFGGKLVTFKSDATGTASLGQVNGSLDNATNVTVERYIPNNGSRSWRLLSVPTFGNGTRGHLQTIREAWQEGQSPLVLGTAGLGTQIIGTGTLAAAQGAGFDYTSNSASFLTWSGTGWSPVTSTLGAIANDTAYFLFIRGDRSKGVQGTSSNTSATTLRTNGTVYIGDQTSITVPASSLGLLGNLYPSAVDFTGLTRSGGISDLFYIWDSKASSNGTLGAYQTFSGTNGYLTTRPGSYGTPGIDFNTTIESGQAFFVVADNTGSGDVTFHENSKISGTPGSLGLRPATPVNQLIKIDSRLYLAGGDMADANVVVFDPVYANAVDGHDAQKLPNPGENFAILRDSRALTVEGRQPATVGDIIPFKIWNLQQRSYELEFAPANLGNSGLTAELEDAYLHTSTPVSLDITNRTSFTVDANVASSATDRFRLVFRPAAPVPVSFIGISASRKAAAVQVDWKVTAERSIRSYEVERSTDGRNFATAGPVTATGAASYRFADAGAPAGTVFYRIKSVGSAGEIKYTSIVKVMAGDVKPGFTISPNPVEGGIVNLQFVNQPEGRYTVRLLSNTGQAIFTSVAIHAGGNSTQVLSLPAGIAKGAYQVEVTAPDKTRATKTMFVSGK